MNLVNFYLQIQIRNLILQARTIKRVGSMRKREIISMILAGGHGTRLGILTKHLAKPAVTFGGKYRIIDFVLSNCINSDIDTVGVLTQYEPLKLNQHIGIGIPWDLDRKTGGVTILPPYIKEGQGAWYSGTANAIYQNIKFIEEYNPEYVLILSGDHIYKMDYSKMLEYHKQKEADATIAVLEVPIEEAHHFGIMNTNEEDRIVEFEEKPREPRSNLASMGIYIFNWNKLKQVLIEDNEYHPDSDFGKHIIPRMIHNEDRLFAYRFNSYWKDVGTIESYWQANMELIETLPSFNLYEEFWKFHTNLDHQPPQYVGEAADVKRSILSEGSEVYGNVYSSVLGSGVIIEEGATVRDSIIMAGTIVQSGSVLNRCIVSENCFIGKNVIIGEGENIANFEKPDIYHTGITVVGDQTTVPDNVWIGKNCVVYGNTKFSDYNNGRLESGQSLILEGEES